MNVGTWALFDVSVPRDMTPYVTYELLLIRHASRCFFLLSFLQTRSRAHGQSCGVSCLIWDNKSLMRVFMLLSKLSCLYDIWRTVEGIWSSGTCSCPFYECMASFVFFFESGHLCGRVVKHRQSVRQIFSYIFGREDSLRVKVICLPRCGLHFMVS